MKNKIFALIAAVALSLGIGLSATAANAASTAVLKNSSASHASVVWKTSTSTTLLYATPGNQTTNAVYQFKIPSGCRGTASNGQVQGPLTGGTWYFFNTYSRGNNVTVTITC